MLLHLPLIKFGVRREVLPHKKWGIIVKERMKVFEAEGEDVCLFPTH